MEKLEAVQTIGARTILGLPTIVKNLVTIYSARLQTLRYSIHAQVEAILHQNSQSCYKYLIKIGYIKSDTTIKKPKPRPLT